MNKLLDLVGIDFAILAMAYLKRGRNRRNPTFNPRQINTAFSLSDYLGHTLAHYLLVAVFGDLLAVVERFEDHLDFLYDSFLSLYLL